MPDRRALVRVFDELVWSLRRDGLTISTAQAVDVIRAVEAVGVDNGARVRTAIAAVVVRSEADRPRFDAAFDRFFSADGAADAVPLWERLRGAGFAETEIDALRSLLSELALRAAEGSQALGVLVERGAELDRLLLLSGAAGAVDAHSGPQLGYRTHRVLAKLGVDRARRTLPALRAALVEALGSRGDALADALAGELERTDDELRAFMRRTYEARTDDAERSSERVETAPFASLDDAELEEVRGAVRRLAARLIGGARVRARHARRGRIDPHRTLRRSLATGGIPFSPVRKRRRRARPRIVVLCDVSDSVRRAATFLLEFAYAAQELFERARSFVFVSDLAETTDLFATESPGAAIARAWAGGSVRAADNSNYGRVLRAFEARHGRDVDRSTTVVILGDGRTNFHDAAAEVLGRLRGRVRALIWFCTEPRSQWGQGDSAMALYAPRCTSVHVVGCAADFEPAVRALLAGG